MLGVVPISFSMNEMMVGFSGHFFCLSFGMIWWKAGAAFVCLRVVFVAICGSVCRVMIRDGATYADARTRPIDSCPTRRNLC